MVPVQTVFAANTVYSTSETQYILHPSFPCKLYSIDYGISKSGCISFKGYSYVMNINYSYLLFLWTLVEWFVNR